VLLCLFWGWILFFLNGYRWLSRSTWDEVVVAVIFLVVPALLIVTGLALRTLPPAGFLRTRAVVALTAITAVFLSAKAILAFNYGVGTISADDGTGFMGGAGIFFGFALLLFVGPPSGVLAYFLGRIAVFLLRNEKATS
jgi:hypothetical protein